MSNIQARVDCEIFLAPDQVDNELEEFIRKSLSFPNPKIGELIRMGYSVWKVPKQIRCYRALKSGFYLPLGFGPALRAYLTHRGDQLILDDRRIEAPVTPIVSNIQLKPAQAAAKEKLLRPYRAILEAKPGFGKTMLGIEVMCARAQKTIIIVHTRALLDQWKKRIADYCTIDPVEIGIIGEGKWKIGERVTIASYQTLLSRGTKSIKNEFGLVVVDECHHVPANTFAKVVRGFAARYCLGLTATPYRKDKLDKLMNFYIGPIIPTSVVTSDTPNLLPNNRVPTQLFWRATDLWVDEAEDKEFTELGTILASDPARLKLVVADVIAACQRGQKCIVLSERVSHAEALEMMIKLNAPQVKTVLVTGQLKKEERESLLEQVKGNCYQVMVATGGVIGEGFDWPAADTLFLTFPFSWKGKLIQYVGRVQRVCAGKTQACVYDYVDVNLSIMRAMKRKRQAGYRELGINDNGELDNVIVH